MDFKQLSKARQRTIPEHRRRGEIILARPNGKAGWKLVFIPAFAGTVLLWGDRIMAYLDAGWKIVSGGF